VEAAWQAANSGARVKLHEMRPVRQTPAHRTDKLAEIVCSNSLKSDEPGSASHLLKEELRGGDSLVMRAAARARVPAGAALAVDRQQFAEYITSEIEAHPSIEVVREEVTSLKTAEVTIVATGPLTSDSLTEEIIRLTGDDQLYFYDAIAPIIAADSIDRTIAFKAARYGKGGDDYLNCPLNEEEYGLFYRELTSANSVPLQRFEETRWFEACLPIEELARRGVDTLRYGPMKPVGLGRSAYRTSTVRRRAIAAGKSDGGRLQHGRLSKPSPLWRTGARAAADSRARARRVSSIRTDSSEHLRKRAARIAANHADAGASKYSLCRTNYRC
jgi:methylenetetrahydrofolate--tRNA-(uracil-5-)-methyltransferase